MQLEDLTSFEDACKVEGLNSETVIPDFSCYPEKARRSMIATAKLVIVVQAANRLANDGKEWVPDWDNTSQPKYFPWFDMGGGSAGFRFYVFGHVFWFSLSSVGSRLCFVTSEACTHVATTFIDLYNESMH